MWSSIMETWDHDLSQNQESDAQLTEPLRCPLGIFLYLKIIKDTSKFLFMWTIPTDMYLNWN